MTLGEQSYDSLQSLCCKRSQVMVNPHKPVVQNYFLREDRRHFISAFQAAMNDMEDRMDGGHSEVLD